MWDKNKGKDSRNFFSYSFLGVVLQRLRDKESKLNKEGDNTMLTCAF